MLRKFFSRSSRVACPSARPSVRRPQARLTLDCLEERATPAALLPTASFASANAPLQVDSGDFDNDGKVDLVVVRGDNTLTVFKGDGAGGFSISGTTVLTRTPTDVVAGNFGGDGNLDVVIAYGATDVEMRPGTGNLLFGSAVSTTLAGGSTAVLLAKTHFNGDAIDDLAIAGATPGSPGFIVNFAVGSAAGTFTQSGNTLTVASAITDMAAGDFDNDGNGDIAVALASGPVSIVFSNGSNGFTHLANSPSLTATGLDAADFTGDGIDDLVVSSAAASPTILTYDGTPTLVANTAALGASGANLPAGVDVVAAKFNDDGLFDFVVATATAVTAGGSTGLLAGGFGEYAPDPDGAENTRGGTLQVLAVDLNGDGYDDIVTLDPAMSAVSTFLCRFKTTTTITNIPAPIDYGTSVTIDTRVRPDVDIAASNDFGKLHGKMQLFLNNVMVGESNIPLSGKVSFTLPPALGPAFVVGANTLYAKYTGNIFFRPSQSADFGQQVDKGDVTDVKITGGGISTYGDTQTFVVTITPPQTPPQVVGPSGTVSFFMDGSVPLGDANVVEGVSPYTYTATFNIDDIPAGMHTITALYNGDGNWNPQSTSNSVAVQVNKATPSVVLSASPPGPLAAGQTVDLSALVSFSVGTPSGSVTFVNQGSGNLGTSPVLSGTAQLSTSNLHLGKNLIIANYSGDANFLAASSNVIEVTVGTPNQRYVASAYQLLLGRFPDADAATWVNMLDAGVSPDVIVLGIEGSTEYLNRVVDGLYQQYLGRPADADAQTWVQQLAAGVTIEAVTAQIIGSAEYSSLHPTDSDFLDALYQEVLGRAPDPEGKATWLANLANGESRTNVAFEFLTSTEYRQDLVADYYVTFLGSAGDPAGQAGWVNLLATGTTDQEVLAGIFGSAQGFSIWSA